jgi:hypothetical protein
LTHKLVRILPVLAAVMGVASGSVISLTGTLKTAEDTFETTLNVASAGTVTLQTWGFGGGVNAASMVIPAGGFDPLVAVFAGIGSGATIVNGASDGLSNYGSFTGCTPAGTVTIGSFTGQCGDITMALPLSLGTYTVILSDAEYIPNAIFDGGTLGEGFTDLTPGTLPLQTCADQNNCITDTANWALDITTPGVSAAAPEPGTLGAAALGLLSLAVFARVMQRSRATKSRKEDSKHELVS